jgi:hypothetical protein
MQKLIFVSLLLIISSSCVTIPNTKSCTVAGIMSAGADCVESVTGKESEMSMNQFLDFLEPTEKRAGAICESASDWTKKKTALEQACRELGKRCTFEVQEAISSIKRPHGFKGVE